MELSEEIASAIFELLSELASEMDLHYEDEDFFALKPTMDKMISAASLLEGAGIDLPDAYTHVLGRYRRGSN